MSKDNEISTKINNWLNEKQDEYVKFLIDLLVGKSIVSFASEWKPGRHEWKSFEIKNIKQVMVNGGYFYPEVSVKDENDNWYTLLNSKPAKFI